MEFLTGGGGHSLEMSDEQTSSLENNQRFHGAQNNSSSNGLLIGLAIVGVIFLIANKGK